MEDFDGSIHLTDDFPALPDESRIKIVEANNQRLVIHVPIGGRETARLGWTSLVLVALAGYFSQAHVIDHLQRLRRAPLPQLSVNVILAVAWAGCLGLVAYWIRMRFERTNLLIERGRVVVQQILFGWKRTHDVNLDAASRVKLVEAYQGKQYAIHAIEVAGVNMKMKFGTSLAEEEKGWLVRSINQFIGSAVTVPTMVHSALGEFADVAGPSSRPQRPLPALLCKSGIRVVESTGQRLGLYIPGGGPQATVPSNRTIKILALTIAVTAVTAVTFDWVFPPGVMASLMTVVGVLWLLSLLLVWRWVKVRFPRTVLRLDRDRVLVERTLFGWKWIDESGLATDSRAEVVESHSERMDYACNRFFHVEVRGRDRNVRFGTALAELEKEWLVDQINEFLQVARNT